MKNVLKDFYPKDRTFCIYGDECKIICRRKISDYELKLLNYDVSIENFKNTEECPLNKIYYPTIICDLDGCLFYTEWIFKEVEKLGLVGKDKWNYFHKNVNNSKSHTCEGLKKLLISYFEKGHRIVFLTARSEEIRKITQKRINQELPELSEKFMLLMRPIGNLDEDYILKEKMICKLSAESQLKYFLAIDDDSKNCEMFKKYKIPTFQWKMLNVCKNKITDGGMPACKI